MIELQNIAYRYPGAPDSVSHLRDINLRIERGASVAIVGKSGSGKTTLLNIIGTLSKPTSGTYRFDETEPARLPDRQLAALRNQKFGFVFQNFQLLSQLTALDNVALPLSYSAPRVPDPKLRATRLLESVGLGDRLTHKPGQLSGGQQQRVAIARALINQPALILADEPTGALDTGAREEILTLLELKRTEFNCSLIVVTHDPDVADRCDRCVRMVDGALR